MVLLNNTITNKYRLLVEIFPGFSANLFLKSILLRLEISLFLYFKV